MSSPAVSSHEARQPVYLGPRFLDVFAWFAADSQLLPGGSIELAPELWKAEKINEATMGGGGNKNISNIDTQKFKFMLSSTSSINLASKLWLSHTEH